MPNNHYKVAGARLNDANNLTSKILSIVKRDSNPKDLGFFSSSTTLSNKITVASSVDGVGTKSRIFKYFGDYSNLGHDIVNHCVNDILPSGAKPLIFLDYLAFSSVNEVDILRVVEGIAEACKYVGCSLVGGETAQMTDIYESGDLEIVGFMMGLIEEKKRPKLNTIRSGDLVVGIPSNGLHTNGYTLVRKIFNIEKNQDVLNSLVPGTRFSLGEMLTSPHKSYFHLLWDSLEHIKSIAHITGGGIPGNAGRSIPDDFKVVVNTKAWEIPNLFRFIKDFGKVTETEMYNVFNMGLGMLVIIDCSKKDLILDLNDEMKVVGHIEKRMPREAKVVLKGTEDENSG